MTTDKRWNRGSVLFLRDRWWRVIFTRPRGDQGNEIWVIDCTDYPAKGKYTTKEIDALDVAGEGVRV